MCESGRCTSDMIAVFLTGFLNRWGTESEFSELLLARINLEASQGNLFKCQHCNLVECGMHLLLSPLTVNNNISLIKLTNKTNYAFLTGTLSYMNNLNRLIKLINS